MAYQTMILVIIIGVFMGVAPISLYAQENPLPQKIPEITALGRLTSEPSGENPRLALRGKDAKIYYLEGGLNEKLRGLLLELGSDNLISVSGINDGSYSSSCTTTYTTDEKGKKNIEARCFRSYKLIVTRINEAKKSAEELPPIERDIREEQRVKASAISRAQTQNPAQVGQIKGIITAVNFRAAIKTIKIAFRDKDNAPLSKTLIVNPSTYVAKKQPESEGMTQITINSLRKGQEVSIGYARDERKTEALFITITKE